MKKSFLLLFLVSATSCKFSGDSDIARIEGRQLKVVDSINADESMEAFIKPYKENIDNEMNMVLAYAPFDLTKNDGDLNTGIGNMMADAVMELSNPVFQKRTGDSIDIVLLNHGGIRSAISKGDVTTGTAFQVMPFENEVVVAALKGEDIQAMVNYLVDAGTAHPVSGLELELGADNSIRKVLVQGKPVQNDKTYYVATNDYLLEGGDNMNFFSGATQVTTLDYKIRNLLIDYFKKYDTIAPQKDQRFIRIE